MSCVICVCYVSIYGVVCGGGASPCLLGLGTHDGVLVVT